MVAKIVFPDGEPSYVFDWDCLAFRALADGKPVECLVTGELLMARFGATSMTEESLRQAYRTHKNEIQDVARNHLEHGWIDEASRVFLTTRFTRLRVRFSDQVAQWPVSRALVD